MIIRLLLFIIFSSSCSQFVNKLDDDLFINESIPYKEDNRQMSCNQNDSLQLISRNNAGHTKFIKFITDNDFSYIEKVVFWTFVQMNLNPHLSSPSANVQFVLNEDTYLEITGKSTNKSPVFFGLQKLLHKFKNKRNLKQLAQLFDRTYPNSFYVSQNFATYLTQNKEKILQNKVLTRNFARAQDTLRENERIPKQNFSLLIKKNKDSEYISKSFDDLKKFKDYYCNFDIKNYLAGSFTPKSELVKANVFGLKFGPNSILISLSTNTEELQNYDRSIFITGKPTNQNSYICLAKKQDKYLWIIGSGSRDPGQQVSQMLALTTRLDRQTIIRNLKVPRYIRLTDPNRLILESEKATRDEIENLQDLKIPLYSTGSIGNLTTYISSDLAKTFFLDLRSPGKLVCGK
jgi:hypothetical protein